MRLAVPAEIDPGCLADWRQGAPLVDLGGETMGTTWRVRVAAPPAFDRALLAAAIGVRLEQILAEMSHWRETSVLGRFNRAPGGAWFDLPADFSRVMQTATDIANRSRGAFDPAIGALVNLWGHGPEPFIAPPAAGTLANAQAVSGVSRLTFDPASGRLQQPGGLKLDLSGIAKGFAVDALGEVLRSKGCHHALVEIGGELLGLGIKPDGDPWWVDLETPTTEIAPLRLALHQLAVATSGDYVRGHHTIDPRSGVPVEHAMAVSVIAASAMKADAWATALSVLPPTEAYQLACREDVAARGLARADGLVTEWISPAFQSLIIDVE